MYVYLDVLFLRELIVDAILLLVTAWVRKSKPNPWRIIAAAAIGALFVICMLFPALSMMYHFIVKVSISLLILYVSFGFTSLQQYLKDIAAFYTVNFVIAGGLLGIQYMLMQSSNDVWSSIAAVGGSVSVQLKMGLFYFISAFSISIYLFRHVLLSKRMQELVQSHLADVTIHIDGMSFQCKGLIDTGNQLYDPLTRLPVMIVQTTCLQEVLPASFLSYIQKGEMDRAITSVTSEQDLVGLQHRLRLVPYRGINRNSQFMVAIKPDRVVVNRDGQSHESTKLLIGFEGGQLSSNGSYEAIIHPAMVQVV